MSDQTSDSPRSDIHVAGNQQKKWDLIMQGNKLCGVISNSTLTFFCAVRSDTKLIYLYFSSLELLGGWTLIMCGKLFRGETREKEHFES